jgi:LysR family transcriptional regulator, low CO2-responsive transcriptional regulator
MSKPGLTLHRLELFVTVLDSGGVARAASARRLSQPAVSEHLKGLEAFFGVRLFERAGRGVRPTDAARLLEPLVRQALGLMASAEQVAVELRGLRLGAITVGASTTPGTYLLPSVLGRFHAAHPQIALKLRIGDTRQVEQWVTSSAVEIGIIGAAPKLTGLESQPWLQDELLVIVPRRHPLARRRAIAPAALAGAPYIAREEGSSTRAVAEEFFSDSGVSLQPAMELGSTEAVREAVAAGLGVSVVSKHAVRPRDARVVAIPFQGRRCVRAMMMIRREGPPLSPAAVRLWELLRAS